jgi:hypothetical protein
MDGFQERKWFVYQTDHHEGPFSLAEIQDKMSSGQVQRSQYVWCDGMTDWAVMTSVREFELLANPATSPQVERTDISLMADVLSESSPVSVSGTSSSSPAEVSESQSAPISLEIDPEPTSGLGTSDSGTALLSSQPEPEVQPNLQVTLEAVAPTELKEADFNAEPQPQAEAPARSFGFLRIFLTLSVVGLGAYGYKAGHLDPLLKNPSVSSWVSSVRGVVQPGLSKLAQWVPALQSVFSPIAAIDGVDSGEFEELRAAVQSGNRAQLGIALKKGDLMAPSFLVAGNLPDGTVLDVRVIGVPDTLLSQTHLTLATEATVKDFVARVLSLRQTDGRPLAQGQYQIVVTEAPAAQQPPEAAQALASLPDSKVLAPTQSGIWGPRKLMQIKSYFLGGSKDDTYLQRLREFHDRLAARSTEELREIRQFLTTLEGQLKDTNREYAKAIASKNAKASSKAWNAFHEKWRRMQSQLEAAFSKWNDTLSRNEFFHGQLYSTTRLLGDHVSQLHAAQHALATNRSSALATEGANAELQDKDKAANSGVLELREKLEKSEKLLRTDGGMPQRLEYQTPTSAGAMTPVTKPLGASQANETEKAHEAASP